MFKKQSISILSGFFVGSLIYQQAVFTRNWDEAEESWARVFSTMMCFVPHKTWWFGWAWVWYGHVAYKNMKFHYNHTISSNYWQNAAYNSSRKNLLSPFCWEIFIDFLDDWMVAQYVKIRCQIEPMIRSSGRCTRTTNCYVRDHWWSAGAMCLNLKHLIVRLDWPQFDLGGYMP